MLGCRDVSLAGDGQTVAAGARQSDAGGEISGQARVHRWNGTAWVEVVDAIEGENTGDTAGHSVALSSDGQTLVVGAPFASGSATRSGRVRVFDLTFSPQEDEDGDGVNNGDDDCDSTPLAEINAINADGCGPSERDTDNDGVYDASDAFPNDPTETVDSDSDGLGDNLEVQLGSNPNLADSDGDGFLDKEELDSGTDPTDGGDFPKTLPVWLMVAPRLDE
ncbi:MAG: hypothetical protein AAGA95_06650 [Pseudomonadota bacterium]